MTGDRSDLYAALGLTSQATQQEIRRAYRTLLRQNHPDTHPERDPTNDASSTVTLVRAISAYSVLGDPASRARYDHSTTTPHQTSPRIRTRTAPRFAPGRPDQAPIQAGPVRWHRSQ
jgi:DnaJ-class molecular chaperone